MAKDSLLAELKNSYSLTYKKIGMPWTGSDSWWEGELAGLRLGIVDMNLSLLYMLGEIEEGVSIALLRRYPGQPLKFDSGLSIERIAEQGGPRLNPKFALEISKNIKNTKRVLDNPGVYENLLEMSESVYTVGFFARGIQIAAINQIATKASVDNDLLLAARAAKALGA